MSVRQHRAKRLRVKTIRYTLSIFCLLVLLNSTAAAEGRCNDALDQSSLNACAHQEYKIADKALNEAYQTVLELSEKISDKERLRKAQRAWIQYRDLTCAYEAGPREHSGTIWPLIKNDCLTRITTARTDDLLKMK